ncbi:MAG: hypothetical protein ACTHJL_00300 [Amnibacterium sp.]
MTDRRTALLVPIGLAVLALTACAQQGSPAAPSESATTTPTSAPATSAPPTIAPAGLLRCTDLGTPSEIRAAYTAADGRDDASVEPTSPLDDTITGATAIQGAGGLACAWSVRRGADEADTYTVSVLPRAATEWSAMLYGDGPTSERRTFAGVSAAATCGDPGCGASARVGDAWVRVDLVVAGLAEGRSVLGNETVDTIFAHASPAISRAIRAVQQADASRLRFPTHPGSPQNPPACESFLRTSDLAHAIGTTSATYQVRHPDGASDSIAGAAQHRIGVTDCFGQGSGSAPYGLASMVLAPGQAWAVRAIADAATGDLTHTTLPGMAPGEVALTDCTGADHPCTVLFSLGSTAIEVDETSHSRAVAEAILAYAR